MNYNVIATGSKGNALLLDETILIDCGVSYKKLKQFDFQAVLLTHIHSDHFNKATIKKIAANKPLVQWFIGEHLLNDLIELGISEDDISVLDYNVWYDIGVAQISILKLNHDVENVGYRLKVGDEKVFYATDTGDLDNPDTKVYDYNYYFIEANYTEAEIEERINDKTENGEYVYENRVLYTHLSKEQADLYLLECASSDSEIIYMHKHRE